VNLDGTWTTVINGQQLIMQFQGNRYQGWINGVLSETGVFQVQGNRITAQTNTGTTFSNTFQWNPNGMSFSMTGPNGYTIVFQRIQ